ncbi:FAD-dependent monooxygenase [Actinomadura sp. NPDC047616]|uniref:FAD-dependent monooxygenase n=1 Tax=Actinomadura sp. NPDC047616 TaxID=3155914 RepID=UPI0033C91D11
MNTDVVIVGGGPTGLMLACELRLAGVRPLVLERLPEPSGVPKANGLLGQVVRMVDRRGLYERLAGAPGPPQPNSAYFMFAAMPLNLSLLDESPLYALPATQRHIEQVLQERAADLGAEIRRGHRLVAFAQDDDAVTAEVEGPDGPYRVRARYLVGADGAHSVTRKRSGIGFPGITYDRTTSRTAHVTVPAGWIDPATGALDVPGYGPVPPFLPRRTEHGTFSYAPFPGRPPLVSTTEWDQPEPEGPMTLDELRASVRRVLGADVPFDPPAGDGPHVLRRLSGGNTRLAERFRAGRVFLVGDAAHVSASGGSGLNLALQDAVNLGWKLAAAVRDADPPGLLDSYDAERRPAARRMAMLAQAQAALTAPGSDVTELRELFAELLADPGTVARLAALTAGSDVRYDMGAADAHPLTGRFAPDLDLRTPAGAVRLAELTATARPLLIDLTEDASAARETSGWDGRVQVVAARPEDPDAVSVTALLLRPDCHVAWASSSPRPDTAELDALRAAAARWLGLPEPARHAER